MSVPTARDVKMRFDQFADLDDGKIEFAIEEALVAVGQFDPNSNSGWVDDANYTLALYYYVAHLLDFSLQRGPMSSEGAAISLERTPEMMVRYALAPFPDPSKQLDLTLTVYGNRYLGLLKRNFPTVMVVNSGVRF